MTLSPWRLFVETLPEEVGKGTVILVVPESIQLSGKSTKPVERLVMLRSEKAFDVVSATLENAEGSVEPKRLADGKWQIKLTLDPGSIGAGAVLRLGTSCKQQPGVEVPLSVPGAN